MATKKNSLVNNINRRKRAGRSRPKSRSTVSASAYRDMQQGWPKKRSRKKSKSVRKSVGTAGHKKSGSRKRKSAGTRR